MLDADTLSEEMLIAKIRECNRRYWEEEASGDFSDEDYDALMEALRRRNPSHPLLSEVHAPRVSGTGMKVHHARPMLSLDKAYSLDELMSWVDKYRRSEKELLLVQPKYDGISAFWNGRVLATRGDGYDGEDISNKIALIEAETPGFRGPLSAVPHPIRGEIVIREDDFQTVYRSILNRNGRPYRNPRNAVAGIMGLKEIGPMLEQGAKLTLIDYNLFSEPVICSELRKRWEELCGRLEALPYPMDGIVVKLADEAYSDSLGSTAHHPRGQMAYKFTNRRHVSKLVNVVWSFGKNCLTPVAEFEPIEIGGTTIRSASLHNLQNILDRDIQIGDYVEVERAGDVIPYIAAVTPGPERRSCVISKCPSCGSDLVVDPPELRCVNPECTETTVQRLLSAVRILGIDGIGESNVRRMVRDLGIRHLSRMFELGVLEWRQLDGIGDTAAKKLYRQIQSVRRTPDWKLLTALNIKGIGPNMAKVLLEKFSFGELRTATEESLSSISGIGPERAGMLKKELERQADSIDELLSIRGEPEPEQDLFSLL